MMELKHAVVVSVLLLAIARTSFAEVAQVSSVDLRKRDCIVMGRLTDLENQIVELGAVMLEYQKQVGKEAREDARLAKLSKELESEQKAAKPSAANKKIAAQMKESQQKADAAMSAATISLVLDVVSGSAQIAGGASSFYQQNDQGFQGFMAKTDALKRDLVKLNTEIKRSDASASSGKSKRLPNAEVERMKEQLNNSLQQMRNAKKSARPC